MEPEDLEPRKALQKPLDLDVLGVEELEEYLEDLAAEMQRVRDKVVAKKAYLSSVGSLFKS